MTRHWKGPRKAHSNNDCIRMSIRINPLQLIRILIEADYNSNGRATSHARVAVARQIEPPNAPTNAGLKALL